MHQTRIVEAEALKQAELTTVELTSTKELKREREDGEAVADSEPSPNKKKAKPSFLCKFHGPDQRHYSDTCKVLKGETAKIKTARKKPSSNCCNDNPPDNQQQSNNNAKSNWTDTKKRPSASHSTGKLREAVHMTRKKAMEDAKSHHETQIENHLHVMQIQADAEQGTEKMHAMEVFVNSMRGDLSEEEEEQQGKLTQAHLDELAGSLSSEESQ
jgi:hypothetical protein